MAGVVPREVEKLCENQVMYRRSWRVVFLLFVAISLLSRNITGAPNVQMSFSSFAQHQATEAITEKVDAKNSPAVVLGPIATKVALPTFAETRPTSSITEDDDKPAYKKYVAPEKITASAFEFKRTKATYRSIQFNDSWDFSNLPTEIHAQGPPAPVMNSTYIGATQLKGVGNFGGFNTDKRDWGFSLNGIRTP